MSLAHALTEVVDESTGRSARTDPVVGRSGGPAGNARLTAWTGLVLLALILAELVTVLDVSGLLSWHVVLGCLLVPFALLKSTSTFWRVGRYYTGRQSYTTAGPPPMLLRILGPLVVASTLALLGSGIALIYLGPTTGRDVLFTALGQRVDTLTLHQGFFIVFDVVVGLHLLARLVPAVNRVAARGRVPGAGTVGGGRLRAILLAATAVVAAVLAVVVLSSASPWQHDDGHHVGPHSARPGRIRP